MTLRRWTSMRASSICFWSIFEMSMIFIMYCFLLFFDSTSTAYPKLPLPTIFTFRYFSIQIAVKIIPNEHPLLLKAPFSTPHTLRNTRHCIHYGLVSPKICLPSLLFLYYLPFFTLLFSWFHILVSFVELPHFSNLASPPSTSTTAAPLFLPHGFLCLFER